MPNRPGDQKPVGALVFEDKAGYFLATAEVHDSAGAGTLNVSVGRMDTQFRNDRACFSDPKPLDVDFLDCKLQPGPGGTKIEVLTVKRNHSRFIRYYVEWIKSDDTAVSVEVNNASALDGPDSITPRRPTPSLTRDQAVALVQNAAFTVTS